MKTFCELCLSTAVVLLCSFAAVNGWHRNASQREAKMMKRAEVGCGYSCNQELAADLGGHGDHPEDVIAVRFCSDLSLPKAYAIATSPPWYVFDILINSHHYTPNRLLLLRSDDCISSQFGVATEYWVIPKGALLPPHAEAIKPCQVAEDSLGSEESLSGERQYKAELQKLVKKLQSELSATGVVQGFYIDQPSRKLEQRMAEAQRYLGRSGLPHDRYLIRMMHWTGEYAISPPEPKPEYPNVFAVEIKRECTSNTR